MWSLILAALSATLVDGTSLTSLCTTSYVQAALPADGTLPGATIDPASVIANVTYNYNLTSSDNFPNAVFDYCNVTFAYSHNGRNDRVLVSYWLPSPETFKGRFLATGGGGLAINSGTGFIAGGPPHGAVAGLTDGGFGGFDNQWDDVFLLANNTVNWESVYMFGYQGIYEMTILGKALTKNFFGSNTTELHTYYQGCSEGGREGMSQLQRFSKDYDGAIIGAPAFRYSFQQVNHLVQGVQEQTLGYAPPTCELARIVNATLSFCDPLDGKTDGVVSRTDLCALQFDLNTTVGLPYHCAASAGNPMMGTGPTPEQSGMVTAKGAEVAATILKGLRDSQGRQVYVPYQYGTNFVDGATAYNNETGEWEVTQSGLGSEWVQRVLRLQDANLLPEGLTNVTYDTLKDWMLEGLHRYGSPLQTTWPDLASWRDAGNKILHWHGESDDSIPTASSVRYWDSVRTFLYPDKSYNDSSMALSEWYKFYSVPGAAHCSPNPNEPNGPFPQTNLRVMIDWVENGIKPGMLNATVLLGEHLGENRKICEWPLRPLWSDAETMECVYDQKSLDTWHYDLDAFQFTIY